MDGTLITNIKYRKLFFSVTAATFWVLMEYITMVYQSKHMPPTQEFLQLHNNP